MIGNAGPTEKGTPWGLSYAGYGRTPLSHNERCNAGRSVI